MQSLLKGLKIEGTLEKKKKENCDYKLLFSQNK